MSFDMKLKPPPGHCADCGMAFGAHKQDCPKLALREPPFAGLGEGGTCPGCINLRERLQVALDGRAEVIEGLRVAVTELAATKRLAGGYKAGADEAIERVRLLEKAVRRRKR